MKEFNIKLMQDQNITVSCRVCNWPRFGNHICSHHKERKKKTQTKPQLLHIIIRFESVKLRDREEKNDRKTRNAFICNRTQRKLQFIWCFFSLSLLNSFLSLHRNLNWFAGRFSNLQMENLNRRKKAIQQHFINCNYSSVLFRSISWAPPFTVMHRTIWIWKEKKMCMKSTEFKIQSIFCVYDVCECCRVMLNEKCDRKTSFLHKLLFFHSISVCIWWLFFFSTSLHHSSAKMKNERVTNST